MRVNKFNLGDLVGCCYMAGVHTIQGICYNTEGDVVYDLGHDEYYEHHLTKYKLKRKITLYRYIYEYLDQYEIYCSDWTNKPFINLHKGLKILLKTETKEIEVDCEENE